MTQLDLDIGRRNRDAGIARVLTNSGDWKMAVRWYISTLPKGRELTGESLRIDCEALGITPHHHNAWGGIINSAVKRGVLAKTGKYVQMKDPKSHARATQVLVKV